MQTPPPTPPQEASEGNVFTRCFPIMSSPASGKRLQKRPNSRSSQSTATLSSSRFSGSVLKRGSSNKTTSTMSYTTPPPVVGFNAVAAPVDQIWQGNGGSTRPWMGFSKDDGMWLPNGQCLIFFDEVDMRSPPTPYFRLDANVLSSSGIPFLKALLAAARLDPMQKKTRQYPGGNTVSPIQQYKRRSLNLLPLLKSFSPLKFPQIEPDVIETINKRESWNQKRRTWMGTENRWSTVLQNGISPLDVVAEAVEITHELWFAVPPDSTTQQAHRHKLAIRNVLAMLHEQPIVGTDLVEMLSDISDILALFHSTSGAAYTGQANIQIIDYLNKMNFSDVRNDLGYALKLLAWSELFDVRWSAGYIECFIHAAGMMTTATPETFDFKRLSQITKHNLQNAHSALHLIVLEVEEKLRTFDFVDMWTVHRSTCPKTRKAFDAFRSFLISFYEHDLGTWPPGAASDGGCWLSRDLVRRLQEDFGALYDFLVDQDVFWDRLEAAYRREWEIVCLDTKRAFRADLDKLPLTDILVAFDDHHGLMHIPCPYPLLPANDKSPKPKTSGSSIFSSLRNKSSTQALDERQKLGIAVAYGNATNMTRPIVFNEDNALLSAFQKHEKDTNLGDCTLQEARLGRWILLYGILQILSQLSVDVGGLKYTEDVQYFLCASLTGCPPWSRQGGRPVHGASQLGSHCWTAIDRVEEAQRQSRMLAPRASAQSRRLSTSERGSMQMTSARPISPPMQMTNGRPISPPFREVSGQTMASGSSGPASPTDGMGMYGHPNGHVKHDRVVSAATDASQWTDVPTEADIVSSGRPSMTTIPEASAEALPFREESLAQLNGTSPAKHSLRSKRSGIR